MRQLLRPLRKLFRLHHAVAGLSTSEAVVLEQGLMEPDQRRHTVDLVLAERAQHPVSRVLAVDAVNAQLGDERVVEPDDLAARDHSGVDTHTRPTRLPVGRDPPRRRQEAGAHVLRVDAAFDGVPLQVDLILAQR